MLIFHFVGRALACHWRNEGAIARGRCWHYAPFLCNSISSSSPVLGTYGFEALSQEESDRRWCQPLSAPFFRLVIKRDAVMVGGGCIVYRLRIQDA